jgi:hypothetical protein
MAKHSIYFSIIISVFFFNNIYAQCTTAPAEAGYLCSGGNGAAVNGQTINNGQTFWYTGTGTFTNQVIVEKGGTFIICGDLTLSGGINIKGDAGGQGIVMVKTGAALRITSGGATSLDGRIYNYGTVTVANTFTINASGAQFINASVISELSVGGAFAVNGSTNFVNFGDAIFNGDVTSNAAASVCMGQGSTGSIAGILRNEGANTWNSPSGPSCISYLNAANAPLNQTLTSTANLNLCIKATAGTISNYGSATYKTNCTSCSSALPIKLASFKAKCVNSNQNLFAFDWSTYSESNNDFFTVEYSLDGVEFKPLLEIQGAGNSTEINKYKTESVEVQSSPYIYFRLKQTDFNGVFSYSHIISSSPCLSVNSIRFLKNGKDALRKNYLLVNLCSSTPVIVEAYDVTGHLVERIQYNDLNTGENFISQHLRWVGLPEKLSMPILKMS